MTASAGSALKQLHEEFGDRVAFVTLYVREAHPGERYPQSQTLEQKLEQVFCETPNNSSFTFACCLAKVRERCA